ncbi:hypothetical protein BJV78DRAFT_1348806 [Lactifluus subvellereus]|nr:hypothetical protein BJV78DRAFT_1348806 [Lactifluus subvellereus]
MVDIYLNVHGSQVPFLSISNSDLRYVMFCICGARGDLSATPDSPPVDYDNTSLANVIYYYSPSGNVSCSLNGGITSTSQTVRRYNFREEFEGDCDAAHLIPHSKGDEYIDKVVRDRSPPYHPSPSISEIDDVRNGVLLSKDVHSMLSGGRVAFLKTPNYGLEPTDIRRLEPVDQGPAPTEHITLQQLKKPEGLGLLHPATGVLHGAHMDALFQGTGSPLPPAIILDYIYGVAAYTCWRSRQGDDDVHAVMKSYRREHYAYIPPRRPSSNDDDDAHGPDPPTSLQRRPYMSIRRGGVMATAMDELNSVLMSLQGITPQEVANRREKRMEEEELKAQDASRSKVMEWMKTRDVGGS